MIPPALITRLTAWLQPALIVALLAVSAWCFWQGYRLNSEQAAHAETRAAWQADKLQAERMAREAAEAFRIIEQEWTRQRAEAEAHHAQRIAALETRLSAAVAERNRLRDEIAAYAAGPADATADTLAAARHRAETLGVLLGQADARSERDARELETLNEEKRLLLEAWPR